MSIVDRVLPLNKPGGAKKSGLKEKQLENWKMSQIEVDQENSEYGKISQQAIDRIKFHLGKVYPIELPFIRDVNQDSITHVAHAIGDDNPLWTNREYAKHSRFGKLVAPPALLYGVAWGSWDLRRGQGLPGINVMYSKEHWRYFQPLIEGDEVHATKEIISLDDRNSKWPGRSMLQLLRIRFYNQRDEQVAFCDNYLIRSERETGEHWKNIKAIYTDDEIDQIDREIAEEDIRGDNPRYFEDVNIGDAMQPIVRGPLTVSDMICWLMGVGSPHLRSGQFWLKYRQRSPKVAVRDPETRIPQNVETSHWDRNIALEIGMPVRGYDYAAQCGGWAMSFLTNWAGDDGWVSECDIQYLGMNFLGDVQRIKGEVVSKWISENGIAYIECKVFSINQRGENIMAVRGMVALQQKDKPIFTLPL